MSEHGVTLTVADPIEFLLQCEEQEARDALQDLVSTFRSEANRVFRQHRINPCCPACHQEDFAIDPESPPVFTTDKVLQSMEDTIFSLAPDLVPKKGQQAVYLYSVAAVLSLLGRSLPHALRERRECQGCGLVQEFRLGKPLGVDLLALRINFVEQAGVVARRLANTQYPHVKVEV